MDSTLDLSAVGGISAAGLKVGGTVYLFYAAVFVFDDLLALDDISAHETHLKPRTHSEELRGRHFGKITFLYIKLFCKGQRPCSRVFIRGIIRHGEVFGLILGVIVDYNL